MHLLQSADYVQDIKFLVNLELHSVKDSKLQWLPELSRERERENRSEA